MRSATIWLPLTLALMCAFVFGADKEGKTKDKPLFGTLSEAPAGGDAKVLGVLKTTIKHEERSVNVIAASDDVAAQIKELVKKAAKVKVAGELSADNTSITVSKIEEAKEGKAGHGKDKGDKAPK